MATSKVLENITNPETTIVGHAVYLEARANGTATKYTTQILLISELSLPNGVFVPMTMFRRRLSTVEPRKTWRMASSPSRSNIIPKDSTVPDSAAYTVSHFASAALNVISNPVTSWGLAGDPLIVEVSAFDAAHILESRTPHKLFGRVWKCRKKAKFPETFLAE